MEKQFNTTSGCSQNLLVPPANWPNSPIISSKKSLRLPGNPKRPGNANLMGSENPVEETSFNYSNQEYSSKFFDDEFEVPEDDLNFVKAYLYSNPKRPVDDLFGIEHPKPVQPPEAGF